MKPTNIYGLIDPRTQEIRYVGKTITPLYRRRNAHVVDARKAANRHSRMWIRGLLGAGLKPEIVLFEVVPVDGNWIEAEQFWIAYWRFLGAKLTNATIGGEGHSGRRMTREERRKLAARTRGRKASAETRRRISEAKKGSIIPEHAKARIAAATKRRWKDPEYRKGQVARSKQAMSDPKAREHLSECFKSQWSENYEEMCAAVKRGWTPERRAKMAALTAKRNQERKNDPEAYAKWRTSLAKRNRNNDGSTA